MNLSTESICNNSDVFNDIKEILADSLCHKDNLVIEIPEEAIDENSDRSLNAVSDLRSLGVDVVVDNFGSGLVSLESLGRFHVDGLKIDRRYIKGIQSNKRSLRLLRSLVSTAHILELPALALEVENQDQLEQLRSIGCDYAQGYHFAEPLKKEEVVKVFDERMKVNFKL
jgi:EAL domain-containing protein (putative c-di-GMP-specific phosphodiesterase class I)